MFTTGEKLLFTLVIGPIVLMFAYMLFVILPVSMVAEEKCLERGYPKSSVTWNLKRYCTNLEGTVTVKVDALN